MQNLIYRLFNNIDGITIEPTCYSYIDKLKSRFVLDGTTIDWCENTHKHIFISLHRDEENEIFTQIITNCVSLILSKHVNRGDQVVCFSDDYFNESIIFKNYSVFENHLSQLCNFPQRIYFLNKEADWCLCIREHSMIDFAFSDM